MLREATGRQHILEFFAVYMRHMQWKFFLVDAKVAGLVGCLQIPDYQRCSYSLLVWLLEPGGVTFRSRDDRAWDSEKSVYEIHINLNVERIQHFLTGG